MGMSVVLVTWMLVSTLSVGVVVVISSIMVVELIVSEMVLSVVSVGMGNSVVPEVEMMVFGVVTVEEVSMSFMVRLEKEVVVPVVSVVVVNLMVVVSVVGVGVGGGSICKMGGGACMLVRSMVVHQFL